MAALRRLSESAFIGNGTEDNADNVMITHLLRSTTWSEYVDPTTVDQGALMNLTAVKTQFNRNDLLFNTMVAKKSKLSGANANPNRMGDFARLPLEVLQCVMDNMDFLTLLKFSQTCRYAHLIVQSHPTLKTLLEHCPHVRRWLFNTQLILRPSINNISTELFYPNCRSCGERGDLFHIPTFDRICSNCNERNQQYWCVEYHHAQGAFNLSIDQLRHLPIARVCHGQYIEFFAPMTELKIEWLIPIKAAFEVAVKHYGSVEEMQKAGEAISPDRFADVTGDGYEMSQLYRWLRTPPNMSPGESSMTTLGVRLDWSDCNALATSLATPFKYLANPLATPEELYSCKGCLWCIEKKLKPTERQLDYMGIDPKLPNQKVVEILSRRPMIARTMADHIVHIKSCLGGSLMLWNARVSDDVKAQYRRG